MRNIVTELVYSLIVLLMVLPESVIGKGCSFREGGCTYNIHLYPDRGPPSEPDCGARERQVFLDRAQNDYTAKIDDMERNFSFLKDKHEQRIQDLESTVKGLTRPGKSTPFQVFKAASLTSIPAEIVVNKSPLVKKMEEEFQTLRDEIRQKSEELAESHVKLNESNVLLHEIQLQHFQTSQDLFNAENEITQLKRERAILKNQLKDRSYRLDMFTRKASECEIKSADLQDQMTELFRSENTLKEELLTAQLKLNETRQVYQDLEDKHSSLKASNERTRFVLKVRELELMECYRAKTSTFCGFEDRNLCGFTNVNSSTDFFDWERVMGQTPSGGTGPSEDHTCRGPNGHFMFIEASAKGRGNNAVLYSPLYRGLSQQCVEFYYHMYGKHVGTLNVYTQARGDVLNAAWRAYGNQGNVWTNARLAIPQQLAMSGYQIVFEGITENGYLGDISIDDVSVTDGPCPVDEKVAAVQVAVNSTNIHNNMKTLARKLRRKGRQPTAS